MEFSYIGTAVRYREVIKDFDWDTCPVPRRAATSATIVKGNQLVMCAETRHPNEAWKFMRFMTSVKTEELLCSKLRRCAPTHRKFASDPEVPEDRPAALPPTDLPRRGGAWPHAADHRQVGGVDERLQRPCAVLAGLGRRRRRDGAEAGRGGRKPHPGGQGRRVLVESPVVAAWSEGFPTALDVGLSLRPPVAHWVSRVYGRADGRLVLDFAEHLRLSSHGVRGRRELPTPAVSRRRLLEVGASDADLRVRFGPPIGVVLSLGVGRAVEPKKSGGSASFRTFFYMPSLVPSVASALLWSWVFNADNGILNQGLSVFGLPAIKWLQDEYWALTAFVLMSLWSSGGPRMVTIFWPACSRCPTVTWKQPCWMAPRRGKDSAMSRCRCFPP